MDLLKRIQLVSSKWVRPGHSRGQNTHNVSATISVRDEEWESVAEWMWENKEVYNGLSVLPHSEHSYKQAPFEDCIRGDYEKKVTTLKDVNLEKVTEADDNTNLTGELACAGGACEIT